MNIDLALVQTVNKSLPTIKTSYVNVVDSMEISEDYLTVGERVYTIGFPAGTNSLLQNPDNENGMQSIGQGGNIIQKDSEFEFGYNAATVGGASGSPVFNKYGKLIGINALYKAVQLWFVMQKPDVPATTKAVIMGALGYLIAPLDFLPDLMPVLGYTDDFVAITFALIKVQGYIDEEVERKSKNLLAKIFGEEAVSMM